MKKPMNPKPATLAVWAGEERSFWQRSTQVPVVHSVSFGYDDVQEWLKTGQGKASGHIYSRNTNPTVQAFEEKVARLEGAQAATGFASGMAAISNMLFTFLSPG
ncbi:MAG: PLP-dependent transferase, partial [Deltaproteobacteria bacterium]|nr:PLP-dependent transferase [Deltaproteobacteria bacterium]